MSCGAWKFVDSMKLHGCIYSKCKLCDSDLCPHWDFCPRCAKKLLQVIRSYGTFSNAEGEIHALIDQVLKDAR